MKQTRDKRRGPLLLGIAWLGLVMTAPLSAQQSATLKGHTDAVRCVCFSPDGKRIVSGSWDKTVKVWDAQTGQEMLTLKAHTGPVSSVAFSADGKHIVSGSADKTVKVWKAHTGQEALTLKGHSGPVNSVAFSTDGKRIASASGHVWDNKPGEVKVWDAASGKEQLTLTGHTRGVPCVCFSPDGKRIASASADQTVRVWDAHTGKEALALKGHTEYLTSVAFSPDSKRIISGDYRSHDEKGFAVWGEVKVWDAQTGKKTLTLRGHTGFVTSVAFSADGKRIASGSTADPFRKIPGEVKVWDAHTGQETLTLKLKGHTDCVWSVAFSADGKRIASASEEQGKPGEVKVWAIPVPKKADK